MMEELDALAMQAGQVDAELGEQTPEAMAANAEAAVQLGLAEQNSNGFRMILTMAGGVFGMVGYPSVQAALTPEKIEPLALTWGPLAAKYGYDLANMGTAYKEEIAAGFATIPVAMAVWAGIKADAEARAAKGKPAELADGTGKPGPGQGATLKPGDLGYREPAMAA